MLALEQHREGNLGDLQARDPQALDVAYRWRAQPLRLERLRQLQRRGPRQEQEQVPLRPSALHRSAQEFSE